MGYRYRSKVKRRSPIAAIRGSEYLRARVHLLDSPELWRKQSNGHITVRLYVEQQGRPNHRDRSTWLPLNEYIAWKIENTKESREYRKVMGEKRRFSDKNGASVGRLQLFKANPDGCQCSQCDKSLSWDAGKGPDQIIVRYLDGDITNVQPENVTAVCPACQNAHVRPRNTTNAVRDKERRDADADAERFANDPGTIKALADRDRLYPLISGSSRLRTFSTTLSAS
jgi:hypothetical protein